MSVEKSIMQLLENPSVGAGNVFLKIESAIANPDAPLFYLDTPYVDPNGGSHTVLSYALLRRFTNSLAAYYHAAGIRPKDPVGIYHEDSINYLLNYIALNSLGAIPVFVNGGLSRDFASRFLDLVGVAGVVTDPARLPDDNPQRKYFRINEYTLTDGATVPSSFEHDDFDPVLIAHTSGTTGLPKAVQFNHKGFFWGIRQQIHAPLGTRVLCALPLSHASAVSIIMSSLLRGNVTHFQTQTDPGSVLSAIESFRPDLFVSFPRVYVNLCRLDLDSHDLSSISYWLSTGDANHEPHIRKLISYGSHEQKGVRKQGSLFIDNLGSSEFGFAMFRVVHGPESNNYGRCIGRPFDWAKAEVFDDNDRPVGPNVVGRLGVKAPSVTAGYWNNTLLTEKNKVRGYWLTGDLVYRDESGRYFHVDRTPDKIVTSTGTLYSCLTEELLIAAFPELFDCSVFGSKDSNGVATPHVKVDLNGATVDLNDLHRRINHFLTERGLPQMASIHEERSDEHLGVTGKKLKRQLRDNPNVPANTRT